MNRESRKSGSGGGEKDRRHSRIDAVHLIKMKGTIWRKTVILVMGVILLPVFPMCFVQSIP